MSELSKCKLCEGKAQKFKEGYYTCTTLNCTQAIVGLTKREWSKLHAPDPELEALRKRVEELEEVVKVINRHLELVAGDTRVVSLESIEAFCKKALRGRRSGE